jgi:uncharacterized protein (TIGR02118 family)
MVVKVVMLYPLPTDGEAFEAAYMHEHVALVLARIPGLTRYVLSKVLWAYSGEPPFFLLAELYFPSLEALQRGFTPAVAQELGAHAAAISTGGPPLAFVCMEEVVAGERLRFDRE